MTHHDYDVLGRCKRCGDHKARFAEDEEPCESEADRMRAKIETREAEIKRLNEALVATGKRISELESRPCPVCGSATDGTAL